MEQSNDNHANAGFVELDDISNNSTDTNVETNGEKKIRGSVLQMKQIAVKELVCSRYTLNK